MSKDIIECSCGAVYNKNSQFTIGDYTDDTTGVYIIKHTIEKGLCPVCRKPCEEEGN